MHSNAGEVKVPLDVPKRSRDTYIGNYFKVTKGSNRLMLFAGDQKVEHLNDDFYGPGIDPQDNDPEHMFRIACQAKIGAFATQLGFIARYGTDYPEVQYVVKVNSKTHLVNTSQSDPFSNEWYQIRQIAEFKEETGLPILGVGFTIYPGSEKEPIMLHQAAQVIYHAHQQGLITILWTYPRGKAIQDEKDPHLIAGVAGLAAALGSDFVKVNYPSKEGVQPAESLKEAISAAGRTKVVCAGGESCDIKTFLQHLYDQIHIGGAAGNATGRNIHQKPLDEAVRFCNAIYALTVENVSIKEALKSYHRD